MAVIDVPANGTGATVSQRAVVRVRSDFIAQLSLPAHAQPLMRVSPIFTAPATLDAFGRPSGGSLVQVDEIVEEYGRVAVLVGGKDVTFFRGAQATIGAVSWQRLGNYETASVTIPAVSRGEAFGVGDLSWLRESAELRIVRVDPDDAVTTLWLGTVNAIAPASDVGLEITAHGLLFDANYRVAAAPVRSRDAEVIQDVGHDIARALNGAQGRWGAVLGVTTGARAAKEPSWETVLDYVKSLLPLAVTEGGNSWTVWLDDQARTSIIRASAIPGRKVATIVAGQDGVEDGLALDTLAGVTAIYGQGVTKDGAAWRNTKFPNATAAAPRYPLDDPDESFGEGSTDAATVSGNGVLKAQQRLTARGYPTGATGVFGEGTATAVRNFQKAVGLPQTGAIDLTTWNRLFSVRDVAEGAWIAPLAAVSATRPRLYDAAGKDLGPNPDYDPSIRPLEQFVDFGEGVSLAEATRAAQAIIARDGTRPVEGDLTLTVCPQEWARWDIAPGDTIRYLGRSGSDLDLIVHRVEWSLTDTPSVRLTVSTRDMDYSELDAALNRIRQSNLDRPAVTPPRSNASGVGSFYGLPGTLGGTGGDAGGGGITGVSNRSASFTVAAEDVDTLILLDPSGGNITVSLPANIDVGAQVHFAQFGVSSTNYCLFSGSGASVFSFNGNRLAGQYAAVTAIKISSVAWVLVGAMAA